MTQTPDEARKVKLLIEQVYVCVYCGNVQVDECYFKGSCMHLEEATAVEIQQMSHHEI